MTPVVIHSLDQARDALAVANTEQPVSLISPPGAAGLQGIGWWQALSWILGAEFPQLKVETILDCGDSPGLALAAIRAGIPVVQVSDVSPPVLVSLKDIGRQAGVRVISPGKG